MRWACLIVAVCLLAVTAQAAVDCSKGCLIGKYFKDWKAMAKNDGQVYYDWRKEANIDYDWGLSAPRTFLDNFGVQWEGNIDMTSIKTIVADCDDAVRLTIGGKVVLSSFEDPADLKTGAALFIHADDLPMWASNPAWTGKQAFKLEYREYYGKAKCRLLYSQNAFTADQIFKAYTQGGLNVDSNFTVVPQSFYTPSANPPAANQLEEYTAATNETLFTNSWFRYATVTPEGDLKPEYFATGYADGNKNSILQCHTFGYVGTKLDNNVNPSLHNVMLKITMGDYVDFYRPLPGKDLCQMLQSSTNHQWAPSENGPWYNVSFSRNGYGGSEDLFLSSVSFADWRRYPSFWYFQGNNRKGGCCYGTGSPMVADEWRKDYWERSRGTNQMAYTIDVRYTTRKDIDPATQKPTLSLTEPSKTTRKWDVYAQVNADIKVNLNRSYIKGWRLNYLHENLHSNFIQQCAKYDSLGDAVVMRYRYGAGQWSAKDQTTTFLSGFNGQPGYEAWFRPRENKTFCDMITSFNQHEWSDDGITWYQPNYHNALCGGSQWDWPRQIAPATSMARSMNVYHLPFWCGDRSGYGKYDNADGAAGQGRWGRGFQLLVRAAPNERWANFPSSGTLKQGTWLNQVLALGGEKIALNITGQFQDWRLMFVDNLYLPNENTTAFKPKAGDVVTAAMIAGKNATLNDGVTSVAWSPYRNLKLPAYFGQSDHSAEGNFWVRYYSICFRTSQNKLQSSILWDDQIAVWIGGQFVTKYTQWSNNQEKPLDLPVTPGQWTQLVVKHVETEWGSGFGIRFPSQDVEWQLQC